MKFDASRYCIPQTASILEAFAGIERGQVQVVFAIDASGVVQGTLTDGDLRRALIAGASLEASVETIAFKNFFFVRPETSRSEVLDIMRAQKVLQVPVVDAHGRLVGLHLLHEMMGIQDRPNWAVIMAGGRGERLKPMTDTQPKPMLKVAGKPILERIILHLMSFGVRQFFIAVHYLPEKIEEYFGDGARLGCAIRYLRELKPMGTAGALSLLPEKPTHPLIVMNGDLIVNVDVGQMFEFHEKHGFQLTVGTSVHTYQVPYGVIASRAQEVVAIEEKPTLRWSTNAGVYVVDPSMIASVPPEKPSTMVELIDNCLKEHPRAIGAYPIEGDWLDVGRTDELARARTGI